MGGILSCLFRDFEGLGGMSAGDKGSPSCLRYTTKKTGSEEEYHMKEVLLRESGHLAMDACRLS